MDKVLAIAMTVAALMLAGCGSGGGVRAGGESAPPARTTTATEGADWQQIYDFYAAEFRLSCTDVLGSAQGKCIATLGNSAHSLLGLVQGLPDGPAVTALGGAAQRIVDDAKDFEDQSCRSGAAGGCGDIPAEVTRSAQSIEQTLSNAAG